MNKVSLLLLLLPAFHQIAKAAVEGSYFSNSLSDCQDLANLFDQTYNPLASSNIQIYPYAPSTYQKYELVSCDFPGTCPDGVTRNTCNWQRFLFFGCLENADGVVQNFVATNSLPNHCYYATNNQPLGDDNSYNTYAFYSYFNVPIKEMSEYDPTSDLPFYQSEINSQTDLNTQLCDNEWAKSDNIDDAIQYSEVYLVSINATTHVNIDAPWSLDSTNFPLLRLPDSDQIVGVALNGVFLFAGTSDYGYDAFFPKSFGQKQNPRAIETDICLGTSRTYSTYRYHMYSPCIYDIALREVSAAFDSQDDKCGSDVRAHAIRYTPNNMQTLTPIGLAKDGRIIYGPFKADGTVWQPCDVDVCNGVKFNKYYGYVSTMFHPYFVGCWGPGNRPVGITQQCSANGRKCSNANSIISSVLIVLATAILAYF